MENQKIKALKVIEKIIFVMFLAAAIYWFGVNDFNIFSLLISVFCIIVGNLIVSVLLMVAEAQLSMAKSQAEMAESQKLIASQLIKQGKQGSN